MTWPLLPMAVRIKRSGWPALWLPLILFWPVVIALFCSVLPLCLLVPAPRRSALAALVASYRVLCELHGTDVEVSASEHDIWSFSLY
jgi:hypothetical protein